MLYKITLHQNILKPIKNHVFQKLILYFFKLVSNQAPIFARYLLCMHKICYKMISDITDSILDELSDWRNRSLKRCYTFVFVDCLYVTLQHDYESAVRKVMYTTNTIVAINSSLRKVTNRVGGDFD